MYEAKAALTAENALSSLRTALVAVDAYERGNLPRPYLAVVLTESEDSFNAAQSTFGSVQPPRSTEADGVRQSVMGMLQAGSEGLAQLRIAQRRGQHHSLLDTARKLKQVAESLDRFDQEHRT